MNQSTWKFLQILSACSFLLIAEAAVSNEDENLKRLTKPQSAINFGGEQHDFRAPIGIVLAEEAGTADEVTFLVLPDGTRTGGDISLTAGQSRSTLPLVSRGAGT